MHTFSRRALDEQPVFELPDRELLGALISIHGKVQLTALAHVLDHFFSSWSTLVSADGNTVTININDAQLTDARLHAFCTEAASDLSVQCAARLT
jgi:hypothetical protein